MEFFQKGGCDSVEPLDLQPTRSEIVKEYAGLLIVVRVLLEQEACNLLKVTSDFVEALTTKPTASEVAK